MITLATLHKATEQEVFDQVAAHLLEQGEQSLNEDGKCVYRNKDGLKCAAGCLIADDEYDKSFDEASQSWPRLVVSKRVPEHHGDLIRDLQLAHDRCGYAPTVLVDFIHGLKDVAKKYGLEFNHD